MSNLTVEHILALRRQILDAVHESFCGGIGANEGCGMKKILPGDIYAYRLRVVESPWLAVEREEIERRSWKERLFSWPWRPWVKEKTVVYRDPDPNFYYDWGFVVHCHPAMAAQLREYIANE